MVSEKLLQLPQGKLSYLHNQHIKGQPNILAIHGWLDNSASFTPLMNQLQQYNWFAIDLPGHGHSFHRPAHCHYHFIDWITDIVTTHQTLFNGEKVHVVGHSLGGMLATVLSGLYPELVDKLVLIDAAGLVTQEPDNLAQNMRKALDSRSLTSKKAKRVHQTLHSAIDARFSAGDLSKDSARLLVERNIKSTEHGFEWRTDPRLRTGSPVRINDKTAEDIIRHIQSPTLICLADSGFDTVKQKLQQYHSAYSNLEYVNVKGGHHCHMDEAEAVARHIMTFL